jgi:hypothetical protein
MGRIIVAVLVTAFAVCALSLAVLVAVFAYHSDAAGRAQNVPADATVTAAFEEAARAWRHNIDWPLTHRLVLRSAEHYGDGTYIFVFDSYNWFSIGSGYVAYGPVMRTCGGGGFLRDGGFAGIGEVASDDGLRETRAACARDYGPGRVVAPSTP